MKEHHYAYFVTLTYDTQHLPLVRDNNGKLWMTVKKSDIQNFFKKLRYEHSKRYKQLNKQPPKISYLITSEYGDKFKRPHYHALIFGSHHNDIQASWSGGSIHFGQITSASIAYTLKYSLKGKIWKSHKHVPYTRPFLLCSKGLGENLIIETKKRYGRRVIKCIKNQQLPETIQVDGYQKRFPRYYENILLRRLDDDKYKQYAIEKHIKFLQYLEQNNTTTLKHRKDYHTLNNYLNQQKHDFDNQVIQ
jgi:hypothetical protein